jgi:hypothetical protein
MSKKVICQETGKTLYVLPKIATQKLNSSSDTFEDVLIEKKGKPFNIVRSDNINIPKCEYCNDNYDDYDNFAVQYVKEQRFYKRGIKISDILNNY